MSGGDARRGLIANAAGGLAGLGIAAALTWRMTDPPGGASFTPPFQIALGAHPREAKADGSRDVVARS